MQRSGEMCVLCRATVNIPLSAYCEAVRASCSAVRNIVLQASVCEVCCTSSNRICLHATSASALDQCNHPIVAIALPALAYTSTWMLYQFVWYAVKFYQNQYPASLIAHMCALLHQSHTLPPASGQFPTAIPAVHCPPRTVVTICTISPACPP